MNQDHGSATLEDLFGDIIEGRIAKRSMHRLQWEGREVSADFIKALAKCGYAPTTVQQVATGPGERVPAFCLDNGTAYFGWVFWEKFSERRLRKLFGSVVRNSKGDWVIQIPPARDTVIYANVALKTDMDIDNPSGL